MKTKEELNALKDEVEALNRKLTELTDEELEHIFGGQRLFINSSPLALNVLNQANKQAQAIDKSSEKISTSQKINLGQDDPISNAIRKHLEELSQRQEEE